MLAPVLLCVDDRPEMLQLRKKSLECRGFQVETAASANAAIKALATIPVATVLLEYKLEGMDAQAVAYQIKQRFPNVPIVLLSAYSEMPASLLWLVDEYVMKSEPIERLPEVIGKVVAAKKAGPKSDLLHQYLSIAV